ATAATVTARQPPRGDHPRAPARRHGAARDARLLEARLRDSRCQRGDRRRAVRVALAMRCYCHPPPKWARQGDSDEGSASDWFSGDEAPVDREGDERVLTRDGEAKKTIQRVGTGEQRPGKRDLVTVRYTVWQVAEDGEQQPAEDPLRWSRSPTVRLEELASESGTTVALSGGELPVGVEVCARMMARGERALVHCSGCYGQLAAPVFGKRPGEAKESGEAPAKLFFRGKVRDARKLKFLPACPEDQGQFVFRNKRLCAPEARLEMEVELIDFLSIQVLTSDRQVRKAIVRKGTSSRKASEGNLVTCQLSDIDPAADSTAAAAVAGCGPPRTIHCRLDARELPHGKGLALVLASMRRGECAIAMLSGDYRFAASEAVETGGDGRQEPAPEEVRLLCTLSAFRRSRQLEAALRTGLAGGSADRAHPGGAPSTAMLKEEVQSAPDGLRVAPSEGGAVLVACERGGAQGLELLSWCLGSGAAPRSWDAAVDRSPTRSMRLYECAAFRLPAALMAVDRPVAAYDGRSPLRRLAACTACTREGVRALCRGDPDGRAPAPEVAAMLSELVVPGWATSIGQEAEWSPSFGRLDASALRVVGAPDGVPGGGVPLGEPGVSPGFARTEPGEDVVFYQWVLLAVAEAMDPCEVEDDQAKQGFVREHRGLGGALVREGSFEEASAAYRRALDACRLHSSFKLLFPAEHGEHFRGCSGTFGAQSYQPQAALFTKTAPDEADAWVRESAVACRSNLALCALKRGEFRQCVEHAGWVLAVDLENPKALFRRGVAAAALGADLPAALRDLEAAQRLQPGDAAVRAEVARVKEKMQSARRAEKAMFKGVLG
ncbi:unnamed protein product, partial [Prorocentrum cordatum]